MSGATMPVAGTPKMPLVIVALATLLALVVFTAPLTTLDAMTATLGLGAGEQAWVMSGMPLGAACGLLTAGAFGDTLGRRRTFVGGLWLTAAASVGAALAGNGPLLIVMRVVQGLGSAGIMACGLGLLGQIYDGEARRHAAAIWAASLGAGVAAGPILASGLLSLSGWAAIHVLIAPVSALLALLAAARLPESPRAGQRVDLPGSALLIVGMSALMSALVELRVGSSGMVTGLIALAVLFLALFVWFERRSANPILELRLFGNAAFVAATLAAFASGAGVLALMSMVPTVLVRGLGLSPLAAAVVILAWSGVTVVAALCARFLPAWWSSRGRVIWSIFGCAIGQALLIAADADSGWAIVLPGLLVAGVSNGILNASLGHEAVQTVPLERTAMGSAANNTARYLGSALGISLISVLIAGTGSAGFFQGWHQAVIATSAVSLLGVVAMLLLSRGGGDGALPG
ncbi:MFS transporter [Pseudodonghicola flavimaris]|uniref:MFS transporter n=1 Tax=Pseudodonghicola flavimaris TaxID=3050036 RepID=A0ABT7F196_9RHOB|nr:MFS transporter [Pseudodonghicola flavimaris]MDK3018376.1 MFS transporter [Pseudodonghicola flavimaris]